MRRWLLPALMITLLLTGCGSTVPEKKLEEQRSRLAAAEEISVTADVTACTEEEIFSCTLRCDVHPDAVTVEVLAPETIAGIRAVTDPEGERIEYADVSLGVGGGNDDQPSPVRALPQLVSALRAGSVLSAWTEWEGERTLFVRSYYVTDDTTLSVWFDGGTLLPSYAEFRCGDRTAVRCVITEFDWN